MPGDYHLQMPTPGVDHRRSPIHPDYRQQQQQQQQQQHFERERERQKEKEHMAMRAASMSHMVDLKPHKPCFNAWPLFN